MSCLDIQKVDPTAEEGRKEITVKLVQQAMLKSETNKFIMDGFPRNEENRITAEHIVKFLV